MDIVQNSVSFVSVSNRQVTDLNLPRSMARILDMVVCSLRGSGRVTLPTNLLTARSAVNRHTAYMDSIYGTCHIPDGIVVNRRRESNPPPLVIGHGENDSPDYGRIPGRILFGSCSGAVAEVQCRARR